MKDRSLGEIKTFEFNNKIILSIDKKWINYFNSDNPSFHSYIKNGKYVLVGPVVTRRPTKRNNTHFQRGSSKIA